MTVNLALLSCPLGVSQEDIESLGVNLCHAETCAGLCLHCIISSLPQVCWPRTAAVEWCVDLRGPWIKGLPSGRHEQEVKSPLECGFIGLGHYWCMFKGNYRAQVSSSSSLYLLTYKERLSTTQLPYPFHSCPLVFPLRSKWMNLQDLGLETPKS